MPIAGGICAALSVTSTGSASGSVMAGTMASICAIRHADPSPPMRGKSSDVRLATFNIQHGHSPSDETVDVTRYADAVKALDADVLALQEDDRDQPRSEHADLTAIAAEAMGAVEHASSPRSQVRRGRRGSRPPARSNRARTPTASRCSRDIRCGRGRWFGFPRSRSACRCGRATRANSSSSPKSLGWRLLASSTARSGC